MRRRVAAGRTWERPTEWNAVHALLAHEARTNMGRELAAAAEPLSDPLRIHTGLELTRQARVARATSGALPVNGFPDIRPTLGRSRAAGSVLDGVELVRLVPALQAVPTLAAYGQSVRTVASEVAAITASLPRFPELADRLGRSLDTDGTVTDDASARLRHLRREIRERRRRPTAELERAFQDPDAGRLFADRYVTIRHGRYVLPLRAEARSRVRCIVHDRSQSGQTLFVEPEHVVEANNDLVQATHEEAHETARILAELTDAVRGRIDELGRLAATVGRLDWIFARGEAADRMGAVEPLIETGRALSLQNARHPLLLAQSWTDPERPVVPMDIELTALRPLLLIPRPNAGGQTLALKTAALLVLMAQTGCHIPAAEGSRLPVVTDLHAIVGDDQSVTENLSTFSAFVKRIREVLDQAGERSLVLLDELGAGTDPDEGAALAQAILEELAERGALVIATTHLEPLKAFAHASPCPQRLGRVRHGDARSDLSPPLRPARPELRADHRGAAGPLTRADRPSPGAPLRPRRAVVGAPDGARRPRAHRGRARARDRADPDRRRGAAREGARDRTGGRGEGEDDHRAGEGGGGGAPGRHSPRDRRRAGPAPARRALAAHARGRSPAPARRRWPRGRGGGGSFTAARRGRDDAHAGSDGGGRTPGDSGRALDHHRQHRDRAIREPHGPRPSSSAPPSR